MDAPIHKAPRMVRAKQNLWWQLSATTTFVASEEIAERRAMEDYEVVLGKEILVSEIDGYMPDDTSHTFHLETPIKVRVVKTEDEDIIRWMDEYLDPVWSVEFAEAPSTDQPADLWKLRSLWVQAPSYLPAPNLEQRPKEDVIQMEVRVQHDSWVDPADVAEALHTAISKQDRAGDNWRVVGVKPIK